MRRRHLEALRPICPVCRAQPDGPAPLALGQVALERGEDVLEGLLECTRPGCRREYPILDGVPYLIPAIRAFAKEHALELLIRDDLSELLEGVLGDCLGPGSGFDVRRQHLSSYAWDHWADLDPREQGSEPAPGALRRLLSRGIELAGPGPRGHAIDVGCGAGRTTFDLAARPDVDLALGIDLHVSLLRLASRALRDGVARWPRRRAGLVHERREAKVDLPHQEKVDFWACDATALPFAPGTFALAAGMHVVDCVAAPLDLLRGLGQALVPDGRAVLSTPYDWSQAATPVEAWLGGHSQRGALQGDPAAYLRAVLTPEGHEGGPGLELVAEEDGLPWAVRMNERSTVHYRCHLVAARRRG